MHSYIKDDNGAYTTFKDGDRFVCYHPSGTSIPQEQSIRGHHCTLYTFIPYIPLYLLSSGNHWLT